MNERHNQHPENKRPASVKRKNEKKKELGTVDLSRDDETKQKEDFLWLYLKHDLPKYSSNGTHQPCISKRCFPKIWAGTFQRRVWGRFHFDV